MPTYANFGGWVISTIAGWFVVTADTGEAKLMCSQYQEDALMAGICETIAT